MSTPHKCPPCDGYGIRWTPGWTECEGESMTMHSPGWKECVACQGTGIIWEPEILYYTGEKKQALRPERRQEPEPSRTSASTPPRRRRTKTFDVSPVDFKGYTVITTCGVTPEQLSVLNGISDPANRIRINRFLSEKVGYLELAYLRKDEAAELLNTLYPPPPQEEDKPTRDDDVMVPCPLGDGDFVTRSHCLEACETRRQQGWCPALEARPDEAHP